MGRMDGVLLNGVMDGIVRAGYALCYILHSWIQKQNSSSNTPGEIPNLFRLPSVDQMAMYIRVKRNKTTYFLQCDATDKIIEIKQKIQVLVDQPVDDQRLFLMPNSEVLDDTKTLADQKVENDAIVALTLRKGDNEFEEINIVAATDYPIS